MVVGETFDLAKYVAEVKAQFSALSQEMAQKRRFTVDFEERMDHLVFELDLIERLVSASGAVPTMERVAPTTERR